MRILANATSALFSGLAEFFQNLADITAPIKRGGEPKGCACTEEEDNVSYLLKEHY